MFSFSDVLSVAIAETILNAHEEHPTDHTCNNLDSWRLDVLSLSHIVLQASLEHLCFSYLNASASPELSKNKASHCHA